MTVPEGFDGSDMQEWNRRSAIRIGRGDKNRRFHKHNQIRAADFISHSPARANTERKEWVLFQLFANLVSDHFYILLVLEDFTMP